MDYLEKLRESAKQTGSIACMGLDPVLDAIPIDSPYINGKITKFFTKIFRRMNQEGVLAGAFKPNHGFYERLDNPRKNDFSGSYALANLLGIIEREFPGIPIILDYKRGDIAKSSANYAVAGLEKWSVDAVTVHPYMGADSVGPFAEYCNDKQGKGVYVLDRTTNKGAKDFQSRKVVDKVYPVKTKQLHAIVAEEIIKWAQGKPGVGAVVGATSPEELSEIARIYALKDIPLLIPGVGGQGGDAKDVMVRSRKAEYDLELIRINSSSGLTHPWAKKKQSAPKEWDVVCVEQLRKLNKEIGYPS